MNAPRRPAAAPTIRVRPVHAGGASPLAPIDVDPATLAVEPWGRGRAVVHSDDGRDTWALVERARDAADGAGRQRFEVVVEGWRFELDVEETSRAELRERATRHAADRPAGGPLEIRAIIPGRIAAVSVAPGDDIVAGHTLLVIEAMKMQNELRAPRDGRVESVTVGVGETIDLGQLLVVLA
jgi:biotin carboxyl carrier protein